METKDILKKVRKIEIKSRGLSNQVFTGHYHSAFKGMGMAFSEVREYQFGDDVRSIDWNVTARLNHPYIKVFEEERELTVILLIDVSSSNNFGTSKSFKSEIVTEIAATLAFSAINNNDKVGVILFSDKIEKFIPPKKGKTHILRIIRELIDFKAESKGTDLSIALQFLNGAIKKKSTVFILSDMILGDFKKSLQISARKHDIGAFLVHDELEYELPDIVLLKFNDPESGKELIIDTSYKPARDAYKKWWLIQEKSCREYFNSSGVDFVKVNTNSDFVIPLLKLFRMRESRF